MDRRLFDTSYWYPPLFWLRPERYASEAFKPIGRDPTEAHWLSRNRFDQSPIPANKVLLFERFDWTVTRRPIGPGPGGGSGPGGGTAELPPQWNNPAARPQAAFVDGSVAMLRMGVARGPRHRSGIDQDRRKRLHVVGSPGTVRETVESGVRHRGIWSGCRP